MTHKRNKNITRREQIIDMQALKTNRHLMSAATLNCRLRQHHHPPTSPCHHHRHPTHINCQRVNGGEHLLYVNIE